MRISEKSQMPMGRGCRICRDSLRQQNLRDVSWEEAKGGMFLWLELPEGLDAAALLRCAVTKNVAFVPGASFYAAAPQSNTARLNFTYTHGERMALGIHAFANLTMNLWLAVKQPRQANRRPVSQLMDTGLSFTVQVL